MRLVRTALVLSLWALAACAQSPPPGEIDIYKVQVQESFVRTDRTSNTYVLRGRGFALSENFGRIEDAFGSHTHVGPLRLLEVIEQLRTETRTAWTRMKAEGNDASPAARRLLEIDAELEAVAAGVERRITSAILPEPRTLVLTPRARREPKFEEAVKLLRNIERYLEHLRESARSAVRNRRSAVGGLHKQRGFDIIFEIGGRPLVPGDWTRPAPHLPVVLDSGKYEALFDHIPRTFQDMFDYVNGLVPPSPTLLVQAEEPTLKDLDQLEVLLKRITESSLNMSHALLNREGTVHTWKEESERKRRRSAADAFEASYEQTLDYLRIDIEKARVLIRRILERLSPPIVQICSNFAAEKVKVEGMAREFAILTHRDHNRPLRRAEKPGEPPVYLTITLKHLFLKHVGNGGANTPILVTCGIKTAANAEEAVYPIIFERNFTPDNPVNRKDRIAYGPYPYRGEFMDFRFTVLHLRSLDSEALINGFANLNAVAGAFNPQLAVLSPIVTALFGAIVRHATEDLVELDASFTFPGQHRPDKPDVDMLVTETGHYVILKNENPVRFRTPPPTDPRRPVPPAADPEPDDRQMMYRWLIFNPENNILYWRRHFTNPRDNF